MGNEMIHNSKIYSSNVRADLESMDLPYAGSPYYVVCSRTYPFDGCIRPHVHHPLVAQLAEYHACIGIFTIVVGLQVCMTK